MAVGSLFLSLLVSSSVAFAQIPSDSAPEGAVRDHATQVKLDDNASPCELACATIAESLSDKLYFKRDGQFDMWDAQQNELTPTCRVEPTSSEEVALILSVLVKERCHFAIKSGGHSRIPNSSNSDGGVTIDLVKIKDVEISKDTKTVRVGSGAVWGPVYETLEEKDLMVVGGRVADVGVGGLLLGGGISFFSPQFGWALDSITEYELVLPNSTIIKASETSNSDLFFALRGGGNNFGIVTHFTLETFPQGLMYGGSKTYSADKDTALLEALQKFYVQNDDLDAAAYSAFVYFQAYDMFLTVVQQVHSKPEMDPPIFDDFKAIESMGSTQRIERMSNLTKEIELSSPHGSRNIYSTFSYYPSLELTRKIVDIFHEEAEAFKKVAGIVPALVLQPLYKNAIKLMKKRGGNALGIDIEGSLMVMSTALAWKQKSDDDLMYGINSNIMRRAQDAAKEMGLYHSFKYINYASQDQDPFAGYGKDTLKRLKAIQKDVDPGKVFQKDGLCAGYFKLADKTETEAKSGRVRDEL